MLLWAVPLKGRVRHASEIIELQYVIEKWAVSNVYKHDSVSAVTPVRLW